MTQTMKVATLLRTLTQSSDIAEFDGTAEGWMALINFKANDSGFFDLVDSILEDGWTPGSSIGIPREGYICQGHHRLVAAILLGIDEIEVSPYGQSEGRPVNAHGDWDKRGAEMFFDLDNKHYKPRNRWAGEVCSCDNCIAERAEAQEKAEARRNKVLDEVPAPGDLCNCGCGMVW